MSEQSAPELLWLLEGGALAAGRPAAVSPSATLPARVHGRLTLCGDHCSAQPEYRTDSVNRPEIVNHPRSWVASTMIRLSTLGATASRSPVLMEAQTCPLHHVPTPYSYRRWAVFLILDVQSAEIAVYNDDRSGHASSQA